MLAAPPTSFTNASSSSEDVVMARELVQVYHALSRNDRDFPPAPASLLLVMRAWCTSTGTLQLPSRPRLLLETITSVAESCRSPGLHGFIVRRPVSYSNPWQLILRRRLHLALLHHGGCRNFCAWSIQRKSLTDSAIDTNLPLQTVSNRAHTHLSLPQRP